MPLLLLGASSASALAACPPNEADGKLLTSGPLQLAWRPVLQGNTPVAPTAIPMAGHFALTVQLCEGSSASKAVLKKVDATMPEHRHGMNYQPRIGALGDGRFRVEGLMFHMSGRWRIEFEVRSGEDVLRLTNDVQIR
ncbi:MAG: hypothetical protein HZB40_21420 [Rhodocyclales bacterium]|nr:hypothetical protein [Rhodocyclales bacterium]